LLFLQGGKCFCCVKDRADKTASIEHIIPNSSGGSNDVDNLAVCCQSINHMLADVSPKKKIELVVA
jgi:5-methylcytosine-specific restriction endonuclease McrA